LVWQFRVGAHSTLLSLSVKVQPSPHFNMLFYNFLHADFDCEFSGSFYGIVKGTKCKKFFQGAAQIRASELSCPDGTAFDKNLCVCNKEADFTCDNDNVFG